MFLLALLDFLFGRRETAEALDNRWNSNYPVIYRAAIGASRDSPRERDRRERPEIGSE
jgi:hypothetical protein